MGVASERAEVARGVGDDTAGSGLGDDRYTSVRLPPAPEALRRYRRDREILNDTVAVSWMAKSQVLSGQHGFERRSARVSVELEPAGQVSSRTSDCFGSGRRIERSEVKSAGNRCPTCRLGLDLNQIVLARKGGGANRNRVLGSFRNPGRASCRLRGRARLRTTAK